MSVYTEAFLGWRVWLVRDGRLLSWSAGAEWPARERMEARCRRVLRSPCRTVPQRGHTCGIYAARERELAEALAVFPTPVPHAVGRVSLWGRVVESSEGFRAQYAYAYELELRNAASDDARTLRERYAVDVVA